MKRTTLIILVFALIVVSAGAVELSDRGYTVSNQRVEDDITLYDVRDPDGNSLTVGTATGSFTNENMNVLEIVRETFFSMEYLRVADMKVVFSRNRADVVIIPERFRFDGINLGALMPSGMRFIYTDFLEYDFRMLVEGLFVRMQGQYFTEQQFVERLARAARNPAAYIQSTDPRYIFARLDELSSRIAQLENSDVEFSEEIEALIEDFREFRTSANQDIRRIQEENARVQEENERRFEEARVAREALSESYTSLARAHEELSLLHEGLSEDYLALQEEFRRLRRSVLVFENRGFFGGLRIPEESVVEEIVRLKMENPTMTIEEAEAAINEGREESVPNKVVTLVFSLYFNEFE